MDISIDSLTPSHSFQINNFISGVYVDQNGVVYSQKAILKAHNTPREDIIETGKLFKPFLWAQEQALDSLKDCHGFQIQKLNGPGIFRYIIYFDTLDQYFDFLKIIPIPDTIFSIKSLEEQFLLHNQQRLFFSAEFHHLKRLQLDIETEYSPSLKFNQSRVLAIGLWISHKQSPNYLLLKENTDTAEKELLLQLNHYLQDEDPDIIEGHNIFKFDFLFLKNRYEKLNVPLNWGRFGQLAVFRKSRLKIAERLMNFVRCDIPGRTIFDTLFMTQVYDLKNREIQSYSLKNLALYFGITNPTLHNRTYLNPSDIQKCFYNDRKTFLAYLYDDLRETKELANILLPSYLAQVKNFPTMLQDCALRGIIHKIDLLFLEKYYHAQQSISLPPPTDLFEGGYTKSFVSGIFKKVLHFDIASLYPSLLLHMNRNPKNDTLGVFLSTLKQLRAYRLQLKQLTKQTNDFKLKQEYDARQSSFKILINSFYGYLGFQGSHFGDSDLAKDLTAKGRELLQLLIQELQSLGSVILEADTDGLYIQNEKFFKEPEKLLALLQSHLPQGIDLEFDGKYDTMLCYKAKNYALYDGEKVTIRGSAFRSRGIEPFLKELTQKLIYITLGASPENLVQYIDNLKKNITNQSCEINFLAKTEFINQSLPNYKKLVEEGKVPRRAALEVALRENTLLELGDQVTYFVKKSSRKNIPVWQRAESLQNYHPINNPYDSDYYLEKINDWIKKYSQFLPGHLHSNQITFDFFE